MSKVIIILGEAHFPPLGFFDLKLDQDQEGAFQVFFFKKIMINYEFLAACTLPFRAVT